MALNRIKRKIKVMIAKLNENTFGGLCEKGSEAPKRISLEGRDYQLTFDDEFSGDKLNRRKWKPCIERERQDVGGFWDKNYFSVKDGCLIIKADIENGTPKSGAIRTWGLFQQKEGYFEVRCSLQKTPGYWFAFWLMDSKMYSHNGKNAEDGAEIDVLESFDYTGGINQAIHWNGYGKWHKCINHQVYDSELYNGFHTYALLWTEKEYIFYIDGKETYRTSAPGMCRNELFLKLTSEFGSWAGDYRKGEFPSEVKVDYVRVYKQI